jgi:PhnB protein
MTVINPYLSFAGNCEEAFEFYRSVFGGEFAMLSRFTDMDLGMTIPDEEKNYVMHVALSIGPGSILMGSDVPSAMGGVTSGNSPSIAIAPDSGDEARRLFDGLSAGGTVTMPLDNAPWGALFGMFTDKYGFNWMVNYDTNPTQ